VQHLLSGKVIIVMLAYHPFEEIIATGFLSAGLEISVVRAFGNRENFASKRASSL